MPGAGGQDSYHISYGKRKIDEHQVRDGQDQVEDHYEQEVQLWWTVDKNKAKTNRVTNSIFISMPAQSTAYVQCSF